MLIVSAGRSRSGSTLIYNLIRLTLIELFGKSNVYGRGIGFYKKKEETKYNIVKIHHNKNNYFFQNADYVFSCHRNESDQKKSILRHRKLQRNQILNKKKLDKFINYDYRRYKRWTTHKNFVKTFEYDHLVNNKKKVIKEISSILNLNITDDVIDVIIYKVNNLPLPLKGGIDNRETCLTKHHFTGGHK